MLRSDERFGDKDGGVGEAAGVGDGGSVVVDGAEGVDRVDCCVYCPYKHVNR